MKKIKVTYDGHAAFKKIASITGFPYESIRLVPTGMGYYGVYFYDEKSDFMVEVESEGVEK